MKNSAVHAGAQLGVRAQPFRPAAPHPIVQELTAKHGRTPAATLPVLQELCDRRIALDSGVLRAVAQQTSSTDANVAGQATFYALLQSNGLAPKTVRVCQGPVCRALGGDEAAAALTAVVAGQRDWSVTRCSCLGICDRAPAALVGRTACGPLCPSRAVDLLRGWRGCEPDYSQPLAGEQRLLLEGLTRRPPDAPPWALAPVAYRGLAEALQRPPLDIIERLQKSGLQGRGGAGFPTDRKWRSVAATSGQPKVIVCNADESEPGAFKDRVLLETDPHLVLEGMALAGYAVGAAEGLIYIRGEYGAATAIVARAIEEAAEAGWLGAGANSSSFNFHVHLHRGAGAYICGEETALLESLEGRRGEPRLRPPYPTTHGYWGRPTLVNNVETLAAVPHIVLHGPDSFRTLGTPQSPGTKLFALSGHIRRPTLCEVPLGTTAGSLLERVGLGMRSGSEFKIALAGGAAGTFLPKSLLDVPIDFSSHEYGVPLGSGVLMFFDQSISAVDLLWWLLQFFEFESCGKCTPCRIGTQRASRLVERIADRQGRPGDLAELEQLAVLLRETSLCGLGHSVAWPLASAVCHFREDFRQCGAS